MFFEILRVWIWEPISNKKRPNHRALDGTHLGIDVWPTVEDVWRQVGLENRSTSEPQGIEQKHTEGNPEIQQTHKEGPEAAATPDNQRHWHGAGPAKAETSPKAPQGGHTKTQTEQTTRIYRIWHARRLVAQRILGFR